MDNNALKIAADILMSLIQAGKLENYSPEYVASCYHIIYAKIRAVEILDLTSDELSQQL